MFPLQRFQPYQASATDIQDTTSATDIQDIASATDIQDIASVIDNTLYLRYRVFSYKGKYIHIL